MRARIASGEWDVTANTWVEGDLNTASGEALVRQLLHARRYLDEKFGVAPLICWEPDTFGHPATYPADPRQERHPLLLFLSSREAPPALLVGGD